MSHAPNKERNRTDEMAAWLVGLRFDQIPSRIVERAKLQVLSVLGAIHAGAATAEGARVTDVVRRWGGPAQVMMLPGGERTSAANAAYAMATSSMTLDYDDYLFPVHPGHSSVIVPLVLTQKLGLDGRSWIAAQVAANEVMARLGASILLGPLNGQACSLVHTLGAAVAAARLMGLEHAATANAIRIALCQPPRTLYAGFMGTGAKAIIASEAIRAGLTAADLAAVGMAGEGDIIGGPRGAVGEVAFVPLPHFLSGYGATWFSDTLCYKIYPGCGYVDAAVDAAVRLHREGLRPADIASVTVRASLLTLKMEELAAPFLHGAETLQQTLNFTVAYNVAAALLDGDLRPARFFPGASRDAAVWDLAARVTLVHDPDHTLALWRLVEPFLDARRLAAAVAAAGLGARDLLAYHRLAPAQAARLLVRLASPTALRRLASSVTRRQTAPPDGPDELGRDELGAVDLSGYRMAIGATVEVKTRDGRTPVVRQDVPLGAAGRPLAETAELMRAKLLREATPHIGEAAARASVEAVMRLDKASPAEMRQLVESLCAPVK